MKARVISVLAGKIVIFLIFSLLGFQLVSVRRGGYCLAWKRGLIEKKKASRRWGIFKVEGRG